MCAAAEVERVAKAALHTQAVSPCDEGLVVALTLKDGSHVGGVVRQVMKKWVKLLSLETMVVRPVITLFKHGITISLLFNSPRFE